MKKFNKDYPIVLGLAGKAGSGKTSTADGICPTAFIPPEHSDSAIVWDHIYFAMPLYRLASIRRTIEGECRKDRILYETYSCLEDLYGKSPLYGAPPFDELVAATHKIADLYIENEPMKPRSFLQEAGSILRSYDPACFVKWAKRKSMTLSARLKSEFPEFYNGVIISDVRFENEAAMIDSLPNGLVIVLEASKEIRLERITKRDGFVDESLLNHISETAIDNFDSDIIFSKIDTDELSLQEQVQSVKDIVAAFID